jgi:aspartyl aminopeptidase
MRKSAFELGFFELKLIKKCNIKKGEKYFVSQNNTSFFTFIVGNGEIEGGQKYTTDSDSSAFFEMICKESTIPYQ